MKHDQQKIDDTFSEDLSSLEEILFQDDHCAPDAGLDKQILAAAQREIEKDSKVTVYKVSWWQKLSLPLTLFAGLTFGVLAIKSVFQVPIRAGVESQDNTINIKLVDGEKFLQPNKPISKLIQRKLPELQIPPELSKLTPKPVNVMPQQTSEIAMDIIDTKIAIQAFTSSKDKPPKKNQWARKIIKLMREGQIKSARLELEQFKVAYPNYPIEEQIKSLSPIN